MQIGSPASDYRNGPDHISAVFFMLIRANHPHLSPSWRGRRRYRRDNNRL